MLVKVCGIADSEFIRQAGTLPVDFTGFIFYPGSHRYVVNRLTEEQINVLPGHIRKAGVFVNETMENILLTAKKYQLDIVQLHGEEDAGFTEQLAAKIRVMKAFRVDESFDFGQTEAFEKSCDYFLFDTKSTLYGGTGKKFNWALLQQYRGNIPFLLSGGLRPEDASRIRAFHHPAFAGIDINSGFETAPGIKETERIKNFLNQIL